MPLNKEAVPLYYEYIIYGHLAPEDSVVITDIQIQNNLSHKPGFEFVSIGRAGQPKNVSICFS